MCSETKDEDGESDVHANKEIEIEMKSANTSAVEVLEDKVDKEAEINKENFVELVQSYKDINKSEIFEPTFSKDDSEVENLTSSYEIRRTKKKGGGEAKSCLNEVMETENVESQTNVKNSKIEPISQAANQPVETNDRQLLGSHENVNYNAQIKGECHQNIFEEEDDFKANVLPKNNTDQDTRQEGNKTPQILTLNSAQCKIFPNSTPILILEEKHTKKENDLILKFARFLCGKIK